LSFAEFWYNTLDNGPVIGLFLKENLPVLSFLIKKFQVDGTFENSQLSEKEWIEERLKILFENLFLPYIKQMSL
jgi:hypothetical protein